jgi:hypothetical protein
MVPEDLLFWIAPLDQAPVIDASVLCGRHADAMVVPRGWTLDDRRESVLRLFRPRPTSPRSSGRQPHQPRPQRRAVRPKQAEVEQLQIDGTGEIERPVTAAAPAAAWEPDFDHDDDLNGLLEVKSPLLARAFRGTGRPKR